MKYRMVIFISPASGEDHAGLAALDDEIANALESPHVVHNHDLGRGHLKVDVGTDHPVAAFAAVKTVIPDRILLHMSAFYSESGSRREHPLWPPLDASD